jgi:hypothetical protein
VRDREQWVCGIGARASSDLEREARILNQGVLPAKAGVSGGRTERWLTPPEVPACAGTRSVSELAHAALEAGFQKRLIEAELAGFLKRVGTQA